jgi:L-threonylcarbamoyladenylate synthase
MFGEMKTEILKADALGAERAAELILNGEVVAIPTETVYGLSAYAFDTEAVRRIYIAKGRPDDKPIVWLVSSVRQIEKYCGVPQDLFEIANKYWAGPLTVIIKCGDGTQGFRIPDNDFVLELIKRIDAPLACTSANISGKAPFTDANSVFNLFNGKIAAVMDGGVCPVGIASTILDMSVIPYKVLRQGSIKINGTGNASAVKPEDA